MGNPRAVAVALILVAIAAAPGFPYETDQYSLGEAPIADSVDLLNDRFNEELARIAADWRGPADRARFARQVYRRLGGRHWVDRLERWAVRSPEVEKALPEGRRGILRGLPFWATRAAFFFGVAPTIRIHGASLGTDKIGHFISQGWKYHRRHLRGAGPERVLRLGVRNEAGIFGSLTTGAFSNADLVANYEGYLFYRSLFEDDVVAGKAAIVAWTAGGAQIQRRFDFRDHVNDYWNEALNPNRYDSLLRKPILARLRELCPEYERRPGRYVPERDEELRLRYRHLGLRSGTSHRLDRVCEESEEKLLPPSVPDAAR
jgi:hypothetical protein